jgi:hypothetical protein
MYNGNYKSLGSVVWKIMKNPLATELAYEECAEYALEFIKLLGAPVVYENKTIVLNLETYKAELPCDLLYINGVRYLTSELTKSGGIALREATNIYHLDPNEFRNDSEFTYSIQKGIIFTSRENGCVQIAYTAIATDEYGYPLIPDYETFIIAMEYYILSRYLEPLWLMGKITDKAFEYIQQKRYFYTPSAFTGLQMPGVDKMESLMNTINRLIINTSNHKNFFKNAGEKEIIRKHN